MTTQFQIFEQLTDALVSGDYSRMAKSAKLAGIFSGQAPNKATLTAKIEQFLNANVSLDVDDTSSIDFMPHTPADRGWEDESDNSLAGADNTPQPTGKIGNECEYHFFPGLNIYAQNRGGQPIDPQFTPEVWDMVKVGLPGVEAIKTNIVKKMEKMAVATKYQYTVTVALNRTVTFESTDAELSATDLAMLTVNQLLEENGQEPLTVNDYGFNVVKGKVKSSGTSRSTSGEGSGFYTASQRSELRPLNSIQKQILEAAASIDGCPLSDYAKYGRQDSVKLGNVCIEFKKKGYGDAIRRQNGAIHFDVNAMYDGYTLSHSIIS